MHSPSKFVSERNSTMARTGENIYKRKDGRWEGRYIKSYTTDGKAKYGYVYSNTYTEVKAKQNIAIANNKGGIKKVSERYLFSELAEKWLEGIKLNCKTSTYNKYRNTYEKQLKSVFGKYPISKISGEMIDDFIATMLTNGRVDGNAYSRKSVQEFCNIIKLIYSYAEESYGIISQFSKKKLSIRQKQSEAKVINDFAVQSLCTFLLTDISLYKIGVLISLYTGIRIGELCALQWKDISFLDGVLYVSKTAQRVQQLDSTFEKTKLCITTPKSTCSNRIIPLPQTLLAILLPFKCNENIYIISGTNKCIDPRTMQYHFKKYLKKCGVEDISFHTLRHTFATRCIELGFDVKTLSEILGHSSVNITLNRYVHSSMKKKQESMNKLIVGI